METRAGLRPGASATASSTRSWIAALLLSVAALSVALGVLVFVASRAFEPSPRRAAPAVVDAAPVLPGDILAEPTSGAVAIGSQATPSAPAGPSSPAPEGSTASVPEAGVALQPDARLFDAVKQTLGGAADDYGVVVYRLSDGRGMTLNADKVFYSASLFKLSTLYEVESEHSAGMLDFSAPVQFSGTDIEEDLGTIGSVPLAPDGTLPMDEALNAMITKSDNSTAHALLRLVGNSRVDSTLAKLGATQTSVNTSELPTTAHDMALLMRAVVLGLGVTPADRDQMRDLLLHQETRSGIPSGLPAGVKVGNKTGNWEDATHDVAFVEAPTGTYIIAVLSDHPWDWEPISAVSETVYRIMSAG